MGAVKAPVATNPLAQKSEGLGDKLYYYQDFSLLFG
jgi:hypothetical protein